MIFTSKTPSHKITLALLALISLISLTSFILGTIVVFQGIDSGFLDKLFKLLNLDYEQNFPTWVSSVLLFLAGLQFLLVAYYRTDLQKHHFYQWLFLGIIFLGISFDEFAHLHELSIRPIRTIFNTDGFLYYPWIIPAGLLTIVVGLSYFNFIRDLSRETRIIFMAACFFYVGGALGMEAIGGYYFSNFLSSQDIRYDMGYLALTHMEEFFEMLGVVLYLHVGRYYLQMMKTNEL